MNHCHHVIFQNFAGTQAWDGDVFLPVVGVNGRLTLDRSGQVLHGVVACLDYGAILF